MPGTVGYGGQDCCGPGPRGLIRAPYEAVAAEHPVVAATLWTTQVGITAAAGSDQADALALARRAAPGTDPATLRVTGARGG